MRRPSPVLPAERDVELRTNFWVIPLQLSGVAAVAAVLSVVADRRLQDRLDGVPLPLRLGVDDARTLLSTLTGASITVVGLVVSLTMVVLSLVAGSFGPRIIRNFIRRRSTQLVIGAFIGTFVYSLLVLVSVSSVERTRSGTSFVPLLSTWIAVVFVLGSTALLVSWVHDLAYSIQTGNTLVAIASDLYAAIDRQRARLARLHAPVASSPTPAMAAPDDVPVAAALSGYLQHVDLRAVVALAARHDVVVHLAVRPGDFVVVGAPLAHLSRPVPAEVERALGRTVTLGAYRTLEQDLAYALAQYVEIALRALSPAVNDPYTGQQCINWIADALVRLATVPDLPAAIADEDGDLRVVVPARPWPGLVHDALGPIRQAAADQPIIARHLLDTVLRIAPAAPDEAGRSALRAEATATAARCRGAGTDDIDLVGIEAALADALAALRG